MNQVMGSESPKIVFVLTGFSLEKYNEKELAKAGKLLHLVLVETGMTQLDYSIITLVDAEQLPTDIARLNPSTVVFLEENGKAGNDMFVEQIGNFKFNVMHTGSFLTASTDVTEFANLAMDISTAWDCATNYKHEGNYGNLLDIQDVKLYVDEAIDSYKAGESKFTAFDFEFLGEEETYSGVDDPFNPWKRSFNIASIALSHKEKFGRMVPWNNVFSPFKQDKVAQAELIRQFRRLFTTVPVGNQNLKLEIKICHAKFGIHYSEFKELHFDPSWAHHVLYMGWKYNNLEDMSKEYLGFRHKGAMNAILAVLPKGKKNHLHIPLKPLGMYNNGDVDAVQRLYPIFMDRLGEQRLMTTYRKYYHTKIRAITGMDVAGLPIDLTKWEVIRDDFEKQVNDLQNKLLSYQYVKNTNEAYGKYKPNGSAWKVELLYNQMKMPIFVMNDPKADRKTGEMKEAVPSADEESRNKIANYLLSKGTATEKVLLRETAGRNSDFDGCLEVIYTLNEYQKVFKLYSTYVLKLPRFLGDDGLIHPTQNVTGTVTGRQSNSSPSFHTLPGKSAIKNIFVSRWAYEGGLILQGDESQAELRIMASQCKDPGMIDAFAKGLDIHKFIASKVFKVPYEMVTKAQRKFSKAITFAILYGAGQETVAAEIKLTLAETQELIDEFYRMFPRVREYVASQKDFCAKNKYCLTPSGRRRWIFDIKSLDRKLRASAERKAFNTPIQGSASDIVLEAFDMVEYMANAKMQSKLAAYVHDALIQDIYPGELLRTLKIQHHYMGIRPVKNNPWCTVPLNVEFSVGASWGEQLDIKAWDLAKNQFTVAGSPAYFESFMKECSYNQVETYEMLSHKTEETEEGMVTTSEIKVFPKNILIV